MLSMKMSAAGIRIVQKGYDNNIPTMQFFIGISRNIQSKYYQLSLTDCLWEFRNDALWDTPLHVLHALLGIYGV